jgi:hypothetical protein
MVAVAALSVFWRASDWDFSVTAGVSDVRADEVENGRERFRNCRGRFLVALILEADSILRLIYYN